MNCLNCGEPLTGVFCASCGQRHSSKLPTIGHLLEETVETLTHADSRLWVTLRYLTTKPGVLTREFFAGRRTSYLPPIRLYLIISVVFFLLLSLSPTNHEAEKSVDIDAAGVNSICNLEYDGPLQELIKPRLQTACAQIKLDNGAKLVDTFERHLPKAMFVLLPAFAGLMMLFFWWPRRLYAEHVIFLVHNHSAIFVALAFDTILGWVTPSHLNGVLSTLLTIYLLWYCWRALRFFYEKPRGRALVLFVALGTLYWILALAILLLAGFASLLTI